MDTVQVSYVLIDVNGLRVWASSSFGWGIIAEERKHHAP